MYAQTAGPQDLGTSGASELDEAVHCSGLSDWMFESSPDCVVLLDLDGRVQRMNRHGRPLMGLKKNCTPEGAHWRGLWPAESHGTIEAAIAGGRRGEVFQFQAASSTAMGVSKQWDVVVTPVRKRGVITQLLAVARDVTVVVEAARQSAMARELAEEASRAKARFVANLGHEIRTPLNALLGFSQLLQSASLAPAQQAHVDKIQQAGQHLQALIDDLLDLSKFESGRLTLDNRDFDLQEVLDRVTGMLGEAARAKQVALAVTLDPQVRRRVFGDPARLCQILLNYTAHALKSTARGEVAIRVRLADRQDRRSLLHFEVADTGRGMSAQEIEGLFADYSERDPTTPARLGAGLAVCRRLASLMGGEVGAQGESGKGSRLWFTARLRDGAVESAVLSQLDAPPAVLRGKHILVVDDDRLNREVAQQLLQLAGAQVTVAEDGRQAVEVALQGEFDAVLMDMMMPVMNGLQATQRLREEPRFAQLPIIAMTANVQDDDRLACARAGTSDFVAKPLDTGTLWNILAHWLGREPEPLASNGAATLADAFYVPTMPVPL